MPLLIVLGEADRQPEGHLPGDLIDYAMAFSTTRERYSRALNMWISNPLATKRTGEAIPAQAPSVCISRRNHAAIISGEEEGDITMRWKEVSVWTISTSDAQGVRLHSLRSSVVLSPNPFKSGMQK